MSILPLSGSGYEGFQVDGSGKVATICCFPLRCADAVELGTFGFQDLPMVRFPLLVPHLLEVRLDRLFLLVLGAGKRTWLIFGVLLRVGGPNDVGWGRRVPPLKIKCLMSLIAIMN